MKEYAKEHFGADFKENSISSICLSIANCCKLSLQASEIDRKKPKLCLLLGLRWILLLAKF